MNERFIFILLFFILMFIFVEENQQEFIFLTEGIETHHKINYLNTDQCMRRPGQESIGSYGLVFKRQRGYLCDMILICYPSQLLANNTLDGIITPIPYRLSKAKQNNITKLCESKRKEYCENLEGSYEYYIMCTLGMGASTTWHGIELSTEYFKKDEKNGYFSTTISLSITDQKYYLYDTPFFNIEFGQKEDIFTRIRINDREKYIKKNVTFPDENLVNEYLSKIGKGAFLYKYTGLWALGLDLLPTPAQQFLHLFVYIGCGCPTDVWFKTPTISSSLVPKRPANVLTVKNKDCKKRYTNHSKFSLGNITGTDNKFINFTVWTDKEVKEGTSIKLISKGGITIFEVYIFPDKIKLWSSVEEIREKNMSNIEAIVDITIVLNRYYSLIKVDRKAINNRFVKKIWPKNWWDGHDLIDVEMIINGDVILVSPINVRIMSEEEITKIPGITQKVPYSAAVGRSISKSIGFDAYCIVNKNASKFSIKLLHGVYEENAYIGHTVIALTVNFTKNNLTIYSTKDDKSNSTGNYFPYRSLQQNKTKIFEKGKPFELYINITDKPYTSIDVNIFVNNNSIETRTIELPIWMIQYIHMDGDIQLFSIYIKEKDLLEPPHLKFVKQVDELKSYGLITCFEASVFPRAQMELNNAYNFQIFMNYDSLIPERDYIERILNLNFVFETGKYEFNKNKTHFKYKEGSDSSLLLRTYFNQSWEYIENRKNPIRAGMYIHVIISATEHYYEIIFVNGGDFLYYLHRYPAWAVNYIVINGTVGGVKFDTQKCDVFKNILPKFKLKTNTYKFRKILKKGSELVIKFFTPIPFNKSIIIYFFHGAIEWNEKIGHTVLALNITNNCTKINSYTNGKWLYGVNGTIAGCKHNLLENQKVRASIKIEGSYDFKTTLETKDDVFTLNGTIKIPFSTVQYIQVIGHDEMKNVTFTMKYNHNDL